MAGKGPPPKASRQRRNVPLRGDWVDLPPLEKPVAPTLPKGTWSPRTLQYWKALRSHPATAMWGTFDIQSAIDLAYLHNEWVGGGPTSLVAEIRQREDRLGLSQKGLRDLRWRLAEEIEEEDPIERPAGNKRSQERAN